MTQINKITRKDVPDEVFRSFIDDFIEESYSEHRRGSNFYTQWIYEISEEHFPEYPQYWGFWETNTFLFDSEYGFDRSEIYELTRVEKREVIIKKEEWFPVEEPKPVTPKAPKI